MSGRGEHPGVDGAYQTARSGRRLADLPAMGAGAVPAQSAILGPRSGRVSGLCRVQNPGSLDGAACTLREPEAEDGGRDNDDRCSKQAGIDEGFDGQCDGTAGGGGGVK